jgi:Family of unknown function (DUF6174)
MTMRFMLCLTLTVSTLYTRVVVVVQAVAQSTPPMDYSVQGNLTRARGLFTDDYHFVDGTLGYAYGYQKSCRCMEDIRGPNWVIVRSGEVESVTRRDVNRTAISDEYYNMTAKTIPDLFDIIQDAIDTKADAITVTYDETYGYPRDVYIDYDFGMADEEYSVTVDYFAPYQEWEEVRGTNALLWESMGSSWYNYTFTRSCECPNAYSGSFRVEIRGTDDGNATRLFTLEDDSNVTVVASRSSSTTAIEVPLIKYIPTIEQLFGLIQEASTTAFALRVTYDSTLGFPSDVYIDYDEFLADEEFVVTVKDVTLLTPASASAATSLVARVYRDLLVGGLVLMMAYFC